MNIIAVNGWEITLGCFVNLHKKTTCIYNGIFAKINSYYNAIAYWSIAINAFQWLASICLDVSPYSLIQLYLNVNFAGEYLLIAKSHFDFWLIIYLLRNLMFALGLDALIFSTWRVLNWILWNSQHLLSWKWGCCI